MITKKEIGKFYKRLDVFELLIYAILLKYKRDNLKSTLEDIHFEAIEYILKYNVNLDGEKDIAKTLPKLATFDKTTQEWTLKSKEAILQGLKSKRKTKKERSNV